MADVYFVVVAAEYCYVMSAVVAEFAAATPAIIAVWMALEKSVKSLSVLLVFRVSVSSSSLSAKIFFDPRIDIVLVLCRS